MNAIVTWLLLSAVSVWVFMIEMDPGLSDPPGACPF